LYFFLAASVRWFMKCFNGIKGMGFINMIYHVWLGNILTWLACAHPRTHTDTFLKPFLCFTEAGLLSAERCTEALFNGSAEKLAMLSDDELNDLFRNTPVTELYLDPGTTVFDVVMKAKCFSRAGKMCMFFYHSPIITIWYACCCFFHY